MSDTKRARFSLDWYVVSASTIKWMIVGAIALLLLAGVGYWGYLRLQNNQNAENAPGTQTARFIEISGQVRVKKANAPDFVIANEKFPLEAGDTIQTMSNSVARVQFIDGASTTIKPDTILVIKDNELMADKTTRVQVRVRVGTINLATNEQGPGSSNVVQTEVASARIGSNTEASVGTGADGKQADIQVTKGAAEIRTQVGETFKAQMNDHLEFEETGKLVKRSVVVAAPLLRSPANQQTIRAGATNGVRFEWAAVAQASSYEIEIATSSNFAGTIVKSRDGLAAPNATFDKLPMGIYYWRVRANRQGDQGNFSEPYKFVLTQNNGTQRVLNIKVLRKTPMGGGTYLIEGRCDTGARIKVGDRVAYVDPSGNFRAIVTLGGGAREVQIVAEDLDGNTGQQTIRF